MRWRSLLVVLAVGVVAAGCYSLRPFKGIQLSKNKTPLYTVVEARNATPAESFAAKELCSYLSRVTGGSFKVEAENKFPKYKRGIFVGQTQKARQEGIKFDSLGDEEWVFKNNVEGDIIICGGKPRGALYGVYEFLEKYAGCRWLDEKTEVVPSKPDFEVPQLDERGKPAFNMRAIVTYSPVETRKFQLFHARNKYNYAYMDAAMGFNYKYGRPGNCHTFYAYSKDWPKDHPEYFSLTPEGKRLRAENGIGPGQICLTNPEVRKLFIQKLREYIKLDRDEAQKNGAPAPKVYEISHNDNEDKCVCPSCKALAEKEGSYSGPMIDFLNELADDIRKDYPDVVLQTFAYTFTEKPPKNIRPRDNVMVRVALLGPEFNHDRDTVRPITSATNHVSLGLVEAWAGVAKRLSIWDYWVLYKQPFHSPYTNISAIQTDLKTYKKNGVTDIFIESEYPETTSFFELKRWLGLKLMQSPDQNADRLVNDFMDGYYGDAAPIMRQYLDYLEKRMAEVPGKFASVSPARRHYMDLAFFKKVEELLEKAERYTSSDKLSQTHIRRERVAVDCALLNRWKDVVAPVVDAGKKAPFDKEKILKRYQNNLFEAIEAYNPEAKWAELKKKEFDMIEILRLNAPIPEQFDEAKSVVDILWPLMSDLPHAGVSIVSDPAAIGGKAVKLGSLHDRTKGPEFHAKPLEFGVYSSARKDFGPKVKLEKGKIPSDGKFHLFKVGSFKVDSSSLLWAHWTWFIQQSLRIAYDPLDPENIYDVYVSLKAQGPAYVDGSKEENAVLVDRIILVKP